MNKDMRRDVPAGVEVDQMRHALLFLAFSLPACHDIEPCEPSAPDVCHEVAQVISIECYPENGFAWLDGWGRNGGTCNSALAADGAKFEECLDRLYAGECIPDACGEAITVWDSL